MGAGGAVAVGTGVATTAATTSALALPATVLGKAAVIAGLGVFGVALVGAERCADAADPAAAASGKGESAVEAEAADDAEPRLARQEDMQDLQESGKITADCWKEPLRDGSETKSCGMALKDVVEHPRIKAAAWLDGSSLVLTNSWDESFRLDLVQLPGPGRKFAFHATKETVSE